MRRLSALLSTLVMFAGATPAFAQLADYELGNSDWLGLSEFEGIATAEGVELIPTSTLDYAKLDPSKPLILIYPTAPLDEESLSQFVVDGGRVLLMDDFGESEPLLRRLEIARVMPSPGNLPHDEFVGGNPSLPVLRPTGQHPLLENVGTIVANHPSVVDNPGGAVVPYSAGGALVYDMNLGDGKVIVVADASIAINKMAGVADNRRFLANALRYVCKAQPNCQASLITKSFQSSGRYTSSSLFDGSDNVVEAVSNVNEAIEKLVKNLPGDQLLYYLSLLLAGGLAVYLLTVYPLRRTRPYSAYVTDFVDAVPAPQSEFDWNVSRFGDGSRSMNHALPMAILKETFESLFLEALGLWPSTTDDRQNIENLVSIYEERYLAGTPAGVRRKMVNETRDLLGILATVPTRSRVFLEGDVQISDDELLKYHGRAMRVLDRMGLKDEYNNLVRGAF